ncbi:MAG TPA: hypothetical protein VLA28_06845, partial [Afifellaceae bacterium]|nr:hypothetical protein [Afifellaceae bacterium]
MGKVVRYHRPSSANYRQRSQGPRRSAKRSRRSKLVGAAILAGLIGVPVAAEIGPPLVGCNIKGNISL